MRYIDIRKLNVSKDWRKKAKKATDELLEKAPADRSKYIDDNERIWKDMKKELEILSHRKCWYCEAVPDGSDFDVDHFRPKNRITNYDNGEVEDYSYWWLAFEYTNFRIACSYCNRPHRTEDKVTKGKATYFPLCNGTNRCTEKGDIAQERPILLDPADPLDPPLLWFDEEEKAVPTYNEDSGEQYERALKTINILNLNNLQARSHRRFIKEQCDRIITDGDNAIDLMSRDHDIGLKNLRSVLLQAEDILGEKAPFSSAAKVYLLSSNSVWVEAYLKRNR
jgi:uncharacterized protein (TIGR02646 family)